MDAISTYKVFLMHKTSGSTSYSKLVDIKEFPDLGGDPEMLETTTLSDKMQTFIMGIQTADGLAFPANYSKAKFAELKALEGQQLDLAVWFGGTETDGVVTPDGSNGKFSFTGELFAKVNGGGVNEVVGMTVTVAPSSPIEFE